MKDIDIVPRGRPDGPLPRGGWNGHDRDGYNAAEMDLRTLISRLSSDGTQLVHDELELARVELRDVAETMSSELKDAGQTLARDMAKLAVSLTLGILAGLTLVTAAVLGIGLLVGAYWAGALIVGILLAVAAALFARSAATDVQESDALRMENTRRTARESKAVVTEEARRTKEFAQHESAEFKRRVTADPGPR